MATAMVIMAAELPVLLTLSWYFGQVLPSGAHVALKNSTPLLSLHTHVGCPRAKPPTILKPSIQSSKIIRKTSMSVNVPAETGVRRHPLFFLDSCLPRRACSGTQVSDASSAHGIDDGAVLVSLGSSSPVHAMPACASPSGQALT